MSRRFYKFKFVFDENMPPRTRFPRLNSRYDVKHIRDDFHKDGIPDAEVYDLAVKTKRIIITFNGDDFRMMASKSTETGILYVSDNLLNEQIDTKLTAFLTRSKPKSLLGKFISITNETVM